MALLPTVLTGQSYKADQPERLFPHFFHIDRQSHAPLGQGILGQRPGTEKEFRDKWLAGRSEAAKHCMAGVGHPFPEAVRLDGGQPGNTATGDQTCASTADPGTMWSYGR